MKSAETAAKTIKKNNQQSRLAMKSNIFMSTRAGILLKVMIVCICLLTTVFFSSPFATARDEKESSLLHSASGAVYRVIACMPAPKEILTVLDAPKIRQLEQQGWTTIIFKGGPFCVFNYRDTVYLIAGGGSAYLVSTAGHWVTNEHVTAPRRELTLFLLKNFRPKLDIAPIEVLWENKAKDLAIFKADPPQGVKPLQFANPGSIFPTQNVVAFGFPGMADKLSGTNLYNDEAYLKPKITSGVLSNQYSSNGTKIWQHNAAIAGGNSGGPLVNECAQIVGTNSQGIIAKILGAEVPTSFNGAIDVGELLNDPEMKRLNIQFTRASDACVPRSAVMPAKWLYLVLGLIGIIAACLVAFLAYVKKLLTQGDALPPVIGSHGHAVLKSLIGKENRFILGDSGRKWHQDINGRWYYYDAVAGVVYGDPKQISKLQPGKTLRLRSAQREDIVIQEGQSLVVGSAKDKVQVVIAEQYISRAHARLSNESGRLFVEDLGSTNGTFINGRRLMAREVLNPGDMLSLSAKAGLAEFQLDGETAARTPWAGALAPQFLGAKVMPLGLNSPITIGRASDNTLVVADKLISAHHCVLIAKGNGVFELRDADSRNGTFVQGNPTRINTVNIKAGQAFYLVKPIFAFKILAD